MTHAKHVPAEEELGRGEMDADAVAHGLRECSNCELLKARINRLQALCNEQKARISDLESKVAKYCDSYEHDVRDVGGSYGVRYLGVRPRTGNNVFFPCVHVQRLLQYTLNII